MANNTHLYGFRWHSARNGGKEMPAPMRKHVATSQNDQSDGAAASVDLNIGDPVKLVSTGGVTLANTTDAVYGIIVGIAPYWNGTAMTPGKKLPNQTNWGTVESRRSYVYVVPAKAGYWEIDVDEATTFTTEATYRAAIGENVDHTCVGSGTTADPRIDISGHATTSTLGWRIEDISPSLHNRDFSGTNVKIIVSVNESQEAGSVSDADAAYAHAGV